MGIPICRGERNPLGRNVSISSPSGEGGGHRHFLCGTNISVSISSPSGEGGGLKKNACSEYITHLETFPLVLLQVKAVGFILPLLCEKSFH